MTKSLLTAEEEAAFRKAAQTALAKFDDIVMVSADSASQREGTETPLFTVLFFENASGIVIPEAWQEIDGIKEQIEAILRQESKGLSGEALD